MYFVSYFECDIAYGLLLYTNAYKNILYKTKHTDIHEHLCVLYSTYFECDIAYGLSLSTKPETSCVYLRGGLRA